MQRHPVAFAVEHDGAKAMRADGMNRLQHLTPMGRYRLNGLRKAPLGVEIDELSSRRGHDDGGERVGSRPGTDRDVLIAGNADEHERRGIEHVYKPTVSKRKATKAAIQHLVDTFFDGAPERAAVALLDDVKDRLTAEQRAQLAALIAAASKEGR